MKKYLILTMLVVMAGLVASEVKAQPPWAPAWGKRRKQQQAYYYYPRANVYYSPDARRYYYPRNGVWLSVATPNFGFSFSNMPRETVYYDGPDVWVENRVHIERYHGIWHDDEYYNPYRDRYYNKRYKHRHNDDDDDDDDD